MRSVWPEPDIPSRRRHESKLIARMRPRVRAKLCGQDGGPIPDDTVRIIAPGDALTYQAS